METLATMQAYNENVENFNLQKFKLLDEFGYKWIAYVDGNVIASDFEHSALLEKIDGLGIPRGRVVVARFIRGATIILPCKS